jgi:hypothetical protein
MALVPGIFSIEAPHAVRTVEAIAPTMLLASTGACALLGWLAKPYLWHNTNVQFGRLLGVGLLVAALGLNGARYFVAWPATPKAYEEFFVAETHIGEVVQRLSQQPELRANGYRIFLPAGASRNEVLRYLTTGIDLGTFADGQLPAAEGDRALLIDYGGQQPAARRALGADTVLLGAGPISPLTGLPEFEVYGRGDEARPAVERALAAWMAP